MNLLPKKLKERISGKKLVFWISLASIVMCLASLSLSTYLIYNHQILSFTRQKLEIEKSAIEKTIYGTRYQEVKNELNAFNKELTVLSSIDKDMYSVPRVMNSIYDLLITKISLKTFVLSDSDKTVYLTGIAENREDLLNLQKKLENSDFIEEVISPRSNFDTKYNISFQIQIKLITNKLPRYGSTSDS